MAWKRSHLHFLSALEAQKRLREEEACAAAEKLEEEAAAAAKRVQDLLAADNKRAEDLANTLRILQRAQ